MEYCRSNLANGDLFLEHLMVGSTWRPCETGIIEGTPVSDTGLSQRRKWMTLVAATIGSSMALLDGSVVNIALPAIQHALQADAAATQWIVNAYLLLLGALVLAGGSAADLYGRRRIFILGISIFITASLACGFAPNIAMLIASRAIQGFGAALLTPASLAMLGATFGEHERNRAIGIWAAAGALTMAAGPALGGWLVDQISWRAIFLLNVPLAIAALGFACRSVRESSDPHAKQLDWSGVASAVTGLLAFTWGLSAIPELGLRDKTVLAALCVGAAMLTSFVVIEARLRDLAMMPLSLYRSRNFAAANALTLLLYFALGGALYYLPFGLIRLGGYSATEAGASLLPFALMMGFGASFAGTIADHFGPRLLLTVGPMIAACGLTMLAATDLTGPYWVEVFPSMLLLGAGMAITVPPLTSTVLGAVGKAQAGVASGVSNAVARVAGLLAVAALGAMFFAVFQYNLDGATPAATSDALNAVMSGQPDAGAEAIAAFKRALRTILLVPAGCAALAGLVGRGLIQSNSARESIPAFHDAPDENSRNV